MKGFAVLMLLVVAAVSFSFAEEAAEAAAEVTSAAPAKTKPAKAKKKKKFVRTAPAPAPATSAAPQAAVKLDDVQQKPKSKMQEALQIWLKDLKSRVNRAQSQTNQIVAVAAVRGAETPDSPPLYWKGKKSQGPVEKPELKDFESALETALTGDPMAAKERLQNFLLAYPKSALVPDAQETLKRLDAASVTP